MMRLHTAARFFDKSQATDPYGVETPIFCQVEPFDYVKIQGAQVKRRVMSTAPEVEMFPRHTLTIDGQVYVVGDRATDEWEGTRIRTRYVMQGADDFVYVRTIGQVLTQQEGFAACAAIEYSKYTTDSRVDSEWRPQFSIFFGKGEPVPKDCLIFTTSMEGISFGDFINAGGFPYDFGTYEEPNPDTPDLDGGEILGRVFYTRLVDSSVSGLVVAMTEELDRPSLDKVLVSNRVYDPITDSYTGTDTETIVIRMRWSTRFEYLSIDSTTYLRNDLTVFAPLTLEVNVSDKITFSDGAWTVLGVQVYDEYKQVHLRMI